MLLAAAYSVDTDHEFRYDSSTSGACSGVTTGGTCVVQVTPSANIDDPKVYYQLTNYYGSHKNYVESRSYPQLRGDEGDSVSDWSPITENEDVGSSLSDFGNTVTLDDDEDAIPCGLAAKYVFQDTFSILDTSDSSTVAIDTSSVALSVDKDSRFGNTDDLTEQWYDMDLESFNVWMQIELFPTFSKLYGKVGQTLQKGRTYNVTVTYNDNYDEFDVERSIIFKNTSYLGEDKVLGFVFLTASIIMIHLTIAMFVLEMLKAYGKLPYQKTEL